MIATKQKFLLASILGLFLIGGNAEAQSGGITQQQMANRVQLINDWADGGFRQCIVDGYSTKVCNCIAGGMRETPVIDILVAVSLTNSGLPIENTKALKHVEYVSSICFKHAR